MGLLSLVFKIVAAVVLVVVGLGAYLYFTDYEAKATIESKGEDAEGDYIVIQPRLVPKSFTKHLDAGTADYVCEGYEVSFRVQSQEYKVFDTKGRLVYDSVDGLQNAASLAQCAATGGVLV